MTTRTFIPVPLSVRPALPELHAVVAVLAIASIVELAILRTFTRTAIHIPAIAELRGPFSALSQGGEYAYFVSLTLLFPAILVVGKGLLGSESPGRLVAVYGLVLFVVAFFVAAREPSSEIANVATIASIVALATAFAMSGWHHRSMLPVFSFAFASVAGGAYTLMPSLELRGLASGQQAWMLNGMEWAGLAFAVTTPLIVGHRPTGVARWLAVAAFIAVLAAFLGGGSSSRFLLLWNVGLAGTLPGIAYALAAAGLVAAISGLLMRGRWLTAAGVALLVTGGIGLHSTYQSALVVVGLATLCYSSASVGLSNPAPRSAPKDWLGGQ